MLPQRSEIDDNSGHLLAYIYDVNGGKGASYSGIDREPVTYDQISPNMRKADRGDRGQPATGARARWTRRAPCGP